MPAMQYIGLRDKAQTKGKVELLDFQAFIYCIIGSKLPKWYRKWDYFSPTFLSASLPSSPGRPTGGP